MIAYAQGGGSRQNSRLTARREFPQIGDANPILIAPPAIVAKPQRVSSMARASRPGRVDERIMNVLLRVIDDLRNVSIRFVDELTQPAGVPSSERLVARSNGRLEILNEETNDLFLVAVGHGHVAVPQD